MRAGWKEAAAVLAAAALVVAAGCGGEKESADDESTLRIPDSLLSPIEGYGLTVDEYHPVNGGIMSNGDIELRYPPGEVAKFIAVKSFGMILEGWRHVTREIGRPVDGKVVIIGAADLEEYRVMTRKEWWYYAWIKGDSIFSEPINVLLKRWDPVTGKTLAEIGLTQRLAQMALDGLSDGRMPVWMKESAASYVADERAVLRMQIHQFNKRLPGFAPPVEELEDHILLGTDMEMSRLSYFYVYRMLENLLEGRDFDSVTGFARRLGKGASLDEASLAEFGMRYDEMVEAVRPEDITDGMGPLPQPGDRAVEEHDHRH